MKAFNIKVAVLSQCLCLFLLANCSVRRLGGETVGTLSADGIAFIEQMKLSPVGTWEVKDADGSVIGQMEVSGDTEEFNGQTYFLVTSANGDLEMTGFAILQEAGVDYVAVLNGDQVEGAIIGDASANSMSTLAEGSSDTIEVIFTLLP